MRIPSGTIIVLYAAVGAGFVAGKLDLDVKLRDAIKASQMRLAKLNAVTLVDELENRKLGVVAKP
jgi:hypothetical protein